MTRDGINIDAAKQFLANVETRVSLHDNEMLEAEMTLEEIAEYIYAIRSKISCTEYT